jgi:hypothetical protein
VSRDQTLEPAAVEISITGSLDEQRHPSGKVGSVPKQGMATNRPGALLLILTGRCLQGICKAQGPPDRQPRDVVVRLLAEMPQETFASLLRTPSGAKAGCRHVNQAERHV